MPLATRLPGARPASSIPSVVDASGARRKPRSWRRRLALTLTTTFVCLLVVELGLRLVLGNLDIAPFRVSPGDGRCVGLEPNAESSYTGMLLRIPTVAHRVNAHGFRGPARGEAPASDKLRIAALGDSFTFGQGVADDQALPAVLEGELAARGRQDVEVLNFGIPGLNLTEITAQYRHFARRWKPRVVALFLFENDLDRGLCETLDRSAFMWSLRHLRLFRLGVVALAPESLGEPNPHSSPARVAALRSQLAELRALVEADGARLLLISLADPLSDARTTRSIAADERIPALVFDRERFESFDTIPNETHWTAEANQQAARAISEWMAPRLPPPN